jgi:hypothetical protein
MIINIMKTLKGFSAIVISLCFVFFYLSCDITSPEKNINVVFNTLSINTSVTVSFTDAATNQAIGLSGQSVLVNLNFTGPNADKIVTQNDKPLTSTSTAYGIVTFCVTNSITPTTANPVMVTLVASSNGYQTTSLPIKIYSTGSTAYTLKMVKISSPPQGSSTAPSTPVQTNSGGQTTVTVTVKTDAELTTGGSAGITINSGTGINDAGGNPLTGTLTANVTYTSGTNGLASGSIQTGWSVSANQGGSTTQGCLQTAAIALFTITNQNGQLAKNFTSPITLTMSIPGSTVNPLTNVQVKNGDTMPVYSFDESSQTWKFETNSTAAGPDGKGNYTVTFQTTHLSYYSLSWLMSYCTTNIPLNIVGSYSALEFVFTSPGGGFFLDALVNYSQNPTINNLTFPSGLTIIWTAYVAGVPVGTGTMADPCSGTINLNLPPGPELVDVDVDIIAVCPNLNPVIEVRPSGYELLEINQGNNGLLGGVIDLGTIMNGKITVKGLKLHATYTFAIISMEGEMYTNDYVIEGKSYTFTYIIPDATCNANFK